MILAIMTLLAEIRFRQHSPGICLRNPPSPRRLSRDRTHRPSLASLGQPRRSSSVLIVKQLVERSSYPSTRKADNHTFNNQINYQINHSTRLCTSSHLPVVAYLNRCS